MLYLTGLFVSHYLAFRGNKILCNMLAACILSVPQCVFADNPAGVFLVTHKSSAVESLSLLQIRRLYLGFPVKNMYVNRPVINRSSEHLYEHFLKNVMHMTKEGYKRKIVRRVFRHGADYIKELNSIDDIAEHLNVYTNDVVFVQGRNLDRLDNTRVVVRLW